MLYLLLEYAEMDLSTVIKRHRQATVHPMASGLYLYLWNQMLRIVKVWYSMVHVNFFVVKGHHYVMHLLKEHKDAGYKSDILVKQWLEWV